MGKAAGLHCGGPGSQESRLGCWGGGRPQIGEVGNVKGLFYHFAILFRTDKRGDNVRLKTKGLRR